MDDKPSLKWAWSRHVTQFKFGDPNYISGSAEAIESSNFEHCLTMWTINLGSTNCPSIGRMVAVKWPL